VATTYIYPIYEKLSQKILGKTVRRQEFGGAQIVEGLEALWLALRCPMHAWSWPRSNKEERFDGYDAHQTCWKCMSRRMFDTRGWQSGPIYKRRAMQAR
jgi:hypothetical protein